jgi:hypothetical protein
MTDVRVEFDGVDSLVAAIEARADAGPKAAKAVSHQMAMLFIREAKKNATGPARIPGKVRRTRAKKGQPSRVLSWRQGGPGVVTGFMRDSIQLRSDHAVGDGRWESTVHPSGPYYRRLELGFIGVDSIGRRYAQPPYPFMRPALDTYRMGLYRTAAVRGYRKGLRAA